MILRTSLLSLILIASLHCWANPILRPPTECLVKIHNDLCPKNDQNFFWSSILFFINSSNTNLTGTVTISNLSQLSLLQTGFLVGKAASEFTDVYISLDGEAKTKVSISEGGWRYQLPAIATSNTFWKLGSKHTITVQGTNDLGQLGIETSIQVIKDTNHDTNGDGYPDVFSAASLGNSAQGYVFIYHTNPDTGNPSSLPNTILTDGLASGTFFGDFVGAGDFNGDGYADIIVGSQASNGFLGKGYIFHSSGTTGIQSQNLNTGGTSNTTFTGVSGSGRLGSNVLGGDVNNDGYDDAIFASPWNDEAFIFYSSGKTGLSSQNTSTSNRTYIPGANDNFGTKAVIGDINADGFPDMVVSAATYNSNQGRLYIYISNNGILPLSPQEYLLGPTSPSPGCITGACSFGTSLLLTDLNGDKCSDLAVGGPGFNTNQGIVFLFHSNCNSTTPFASTPNTVLVGPANSSCTPNTCFFGSSLTAGDANGDTFPDLIVGATFASLGKGEVYLYLNNNGSIANVDLSKGGSASSTLIGASASTNFSQSLHMLDVNGDGLFDLFVSAPTANKIYYYKGIKNSGIENTNLSTGETATLILTSPVGQSLGNSLAVRNLKFPRKYF